MRIVSLAFAVIIFSGTAAGSELIEEAVAQCDALAGSPEDLDMPQGVTGVVYGNLEPTREAELACLEAAAAHPNKRRFQTHLGRIYSKREQYREALEANRIAHGMGSALAANNLGSIYKNAEGVPADARRATHYFRKAANRGLPYAMTTMAVRSRLGTGMPKSMAMAFFWYERAHETGKSILSTHDLGVMYQNGYGVREDDARALALFEEAMRRDPAYATAPYNLGEAYETGEGTAVDMERAKSYYARAFYAGDADAAYEIGRLNSEGLLEYSDPVAAADWYARGAAEGSLYATVSLAESYENGDGVVADLTEARSLYSAALALDPDDEWRAYIDDRLTALMLEQVSTADRSLD